MMCEQHVASAIVHCVGYTNDCINHNVMIKITVFCARIDFRREWFGSSQHDLNFSLGLKCGKSMMPKHLV